jgi:hypothetical protein
MLARVSRRGGSVRVGGALLCHLGGPQGATRVAIVSCTCVRLVVGSRFAFFVGFKRVSPGYLGDPYGCP